jgi:hypothetical protein
MAKLGRPQTRKGKVTAIGGGLLALAAIALALVYFVLFPTSSPKRFSLASTPTDSSSPAAASTPTTTTGSQIGGRWKVAGGSEAGYRVREKLAFLPAQSDAVGRTSTITGEATVSESKHVVTVTAASFDVAVNTLKSDKSMRDEKIHVIGLESDRYPTATFALSTPLRLPASASGGHVAHVSATGVFDIHGTSKRETVPLEMSVSSSSIRAVGSLTFPWSEFDMTAPSIGGFVNVTDKATMEFDLHLQHDA